MMKLNILIIFVLSIFELKAQIEVQYNYDPFVLYDNQLVDKIINLERHINSPFLLKGNIETLHIISSTAESETQSSIKYYYDFNKYNIRLTNYDKDLNEVINREFLSRPFYDGCQLLMSGYSKQDHGKLLTWKSLIDSENKIVKIETLTNGELTSLDSVLYIDQFIPIKIYNKEKYNGEWQNKSIQLYEYQNGKVVTSLKIYGTSGKWGAKRFYDSFGRPLYYQTLIDIDLNTLQYSLDSNKNEVFTWNEDGFSYDNNILTTRFDSKSNTIISKSGDAITNIQLSKSLKPVKVDIKFDSNLEEEIHIVYYYNQFDDCVDKKYLNKSSSESDEHFDFIYDAKGNWIEKKMYFNGKWHSTTKRTIEYY